MKSSPSRSLTVGTRTSRLARWQTEHIIERLQQAWPGLECRTQSFVTKGDKTLDKPLPQIGGKGLFTAELERALRDGQIDIAVHSLKDLPVEDAKGLALGAITSRADVRDGLVARQGWTLDTLPTGATVGTSSVRRQAQLLARRPDLVVKPIRGNVDTRIRKVQAGEYDATVLAAAGLIRLELTEMVTQWLDLDLMLPAPGQGALAVQCRADDEVTLTLLAAINDETVRQAVTAERAFLQSLGGGCSAPIAAYATIIGEQIQLDGLVAWPDGKQLFRVAGNQNDAWALGSQLATEVVRLGAGDILASLTSEETPQPLLGKRIVVTRTRAQAASFSRKLADLGAIPVEIPMIKIVPMPDATPIDEAIRALHRYDWIIFTSVNGVELFWQRLSAVLGPEASLEQIKVATVGPVTTRALLERGVQPSFTPDEFVGEAAQVAGRTLPRLLEAAGAIVRDLPVYRTVPAEIDAAGLAELKQGVDIITFTSGSTVRNWLAAFGDNGHSPLIACIGPVTADTARQLGFPPDILAAEYTIDGLIEAIVAYFQEQGPS
jgi:hydroxymethylbilane synthase